MRIISTNIANPTTVIWRGKQVKTGIYKTPVFDSIHLGKEHVRGDEISDRRVHGGEYKACYLFSADHYPYWKNLYPNLNWTWGMFGENLTVEGLDETQIQIGDTYKIGTSIVQVTQPREPCFKFGIKFGTQNILRQFIEHGHPGTYLKVLEEGKVKNNDTIELISSDKNSITIAQFFKLLYDKNKNQEHLERVLKNEALPMKKRIRLRSLLFSSGLF